MPGALWGAKVGIIPQFDAISVRFDAFPHDGQADADVVQGERVVQVQAYQLNKV